MQQSGWQRRASKVPETGFFQSCWIVTPLFNERRIDQKHLPIPQPLAIITIAHTVQVYLSTLVNSQRRHRSFYAICKCRQIIILQISVPGTAHILSGWPVATMHKIAISQHKNVSLMTNRSINLIACLSLTISNIFICLCNQGQNILNTKPSFRSSS